MGSCGGLSHGGRALWRIVVRLALLIAVICATPTHAEEPSPIPAAPSADLQEPPPQRISTIRFEGNSHTDERILRQEVFVEPGGPVDPQAIEASRQSIMDTGLFKTVDVHLEPGPTGTELLFRVEERFFFLPVVLIDQSADGSVDYGLELNADNLYGLNQRLQLRYRLRAPAPGAGDRREQRVRYAYPRLVGTFWSLDSEFGLKKEQRRSATATSPPVDVEYGFQERWVRAGISRPLGKAPLQTSLWRMGLGLSLQQREYTYPLGGPFLFDDSQAVFVTTTLDYGQVHDMGTYRAGRVVGFRMDSGRRNIGSDYDFTKNLLFLRAYTPLGELRSFDMRAELGFGSGELFDEPLFEIGSATTLRGYTTPFRGSAYTLLNLEYLWPISPRGIRAVAFLDLGNAYPSLERMTLSDVKAGVGAGLRWRIRKLVNLTLVADAAFGIEQKSATLFLGTATAF